MKKVVVLLCAVSLLAVPACKRRRDAECSTCHHEKREHAHDCHHKGHCSFFGRCKDGEHHVEKHRYSDEDAEMEMHK